MAFETTTAEVIDGVDLSGMVVVVTGATTGLGRETARTLASAGAHVVVINDQPDGRNNSLYGSVA